MDFNFRAGFFNDSLGDMGQSNHLFASGFVSWKRREFYTKAEGAKSGLLALRGEDSLRTLSL